MKIKPQRRSDPTNSAPFLRLDILPAGVADIRSLPDDAFQELWDAILVDAHVKERTVRQSSARGSKLM
jgi:hypothetical protein